MMLSHRMAQSLADARLRMLLLGPHSSQDREGGRNEQLFSGDVERIVHERGDVLLYVPDLLTHGVDREIARILVNGLKGGLADLQGNIDLGTRTGVACQQEHDSR